MSPWNPWDLTNACMCSFTRLFPKRAANVCSLSDVTASYYTYGWFADSWISWFPGIKRKGLIPRPSIYTCTLHFCGFFDLLFRIQAVHTCERVFLTSSSFTLRITYRGLIVQALLVLASQDMKRFPDCRDSGLSYASFRYPVVWDYNGYPSRISIGWCGTASMLGWWWTGWPASQGAFLCRASW